VTTTQSISPRITRDNAGNGQFTSGEAALLSLLAIGDVAVFEIGFVEQVTGLQTFAANTTGTTGTRTIAWEFRWKNSGGTFTAWATPTNVALAAIAPDEDLPFYIEIRATRGGADATGIIEINSFAFAYTYNPQAVTGYGMISQENLHGDTIALFIAIIQSWVWQVSGGDHYDVVYKPREWVYNTVKPTIYLHGLTQLDTEQQTIGTMQKNAQISIGIKPVVNKTTGYDQQLSRLLAMFDPFQYGKTEFDFTFKGVEYIAAKMGDVGLQISATSGMQEFEDQSTQTWYHEFTIAFSLNFYNFAHS